MISIGGSLIVGCVGMVFAVLASSQAILLDGMLKNGYTFHLLEGMWILRDGRMVNTHIKGLPPSPKEEEDENRSRCKKRGAWCKK